MSRRAKLASICPFKLNETYDTLYDLQQRLGIENDYLMNTSRDTSRDKEYKEQLQRLLQASSLTRDNLITWYLKQTLIEFNVTISLLTAKIKFIEYKLGSCDGLDLHQACSLSLVNFCNILADQTVHNVGPSERKTMHMISKEANIPVWLSHYRNQICHVPSESPCISILVPLVIKSLDYMRDYFWSEVLELDSFDAQNCANLVSSISKLTHITSINKQFKLKSNSEPNTVKSEILKSELEGCKKGCFSLRKMFYYHPDAAIKIMSQFLSNFRPSDDNRNFGLLIEQIIEARSFERFVIKLVDMAVENPHDKNIVAWLLRIITLVGLRKREKLKLTLRKMELSASVQIRRRTDIPAVKCCQIAYKLIRFDHPVVKKLILRLRHKLIPILGKKRTTALILLTRVAKD